MKICWDNLEGLRYNKKTGKWYKNGITYIYYNKCINCSEPFLGKEKIGKFCCRKCSDKGKKYPFIDKHLTEEHKEKISRSLIGKKSSKKHCENLSVSHKGRDGPKSPSWKGGYISIPLYNTYAPQIKWCEEVRRNGKDRNILEVRCTYCGKWIVPNFINVCNRLTYLKGKITSENHFYCSEGCKQICPIYGKKPEQLMKEDAVRAGRISWLELNREVQPELRKLVLKRDEYQCVKCSSDGPLHCHHIYPVSTNPIESADIDNCMTLCIDCHKKAHQKDGCRYGQLKTCIEYI